MTDPGQTAYEARFAGRPARCIAPWSDLDDEARAEWVRVETAVAFAAEAEVAKLTRERDEARADLDTLHDDTAVQTKMLDRVAAKLGLDHDEGLEDAAPFVEAIDKMASTVSALRDRVAVLEEANDKLKAERQLCDRRIRFQRASLRSLQYLAAGTVGSPEYARLFQIYRRQTAEVRALRKQVAILHLVPNALRRARAALTPGGENAKS